MGFHSCLPIDNVLNLIAKMVKVEYLETTTLKQVDALNLYEAPLLLCVVPVTSNNVGKLQT